MIDLYTKVILTVIAVALSVNVFVQLEFVGPVHAAYEVQKVQICDYTNECAFVRNNSLQVIN